MSTMTRNAILKALGGYLERNWPDNHVNYDDLADAIAAHLTSREAKGQEVSWQVRVWFKRESRWSPWQNIDREEFEYAVKTGTYWEYERIETRALYTHPAAQDAAEPVEQVKRKLSDKGPFDHISPELRGLVKSVDTPKPEQAVGDGVVAGIRNRIEDALRNERHRNNAETRYWLNQYKGICNDVLGVLTPRPAVDTPTEVTEEMVREAAIECARRAYGYWRGDSTGGASAIEYFDRNMSLPGNQHCIDMFAGTIRKHLAAQPSAVGVPEGIRRDAFNDGILLALQVINAAGNGGDAHYMELLKCADHCELLKRARDEDMLDQTGITKWVEYGQSIGVLAAAPEPTHD